MELNAQVHYEDDSFWAEVTELPGCFASGDTLDELVEALAEAVSLYRNEAEGSGEIQGRSVAVVPTAVRLQVPEVAARQG